MTVKKVANKNVFKCLLKTDLELHGRMFEGRLFQILVQRNQWPVQSINQKQPLAAEHWFTICLKPAAEHKSCLLE